MRGADADDLPRGVPRSDALMPGVDSHAAAGLECGEPSVGKPVVGGLRVLPPVRIAREEAGATQQVSREAGRPPRLLET
jgi:hypothetical protein